MSRIKLTMSGKDAVIAMCDGNPGAINVMMAMLLEGGAIDPQSALGGMGAVLSLDTHRIYGPRIWMLYKDVCGEDLPRMLALLRSVQLGLLPIAKLDHAIDNYGDGIDIQDLVAKVAERLPSFKIKTSVATTEAA